MSKHHQHHRGLLAPSFINPCSCLAHNYLPSTEASKLEDRIREAMQFSHYQLLGCFFFFLPLLKLAPLSPKPPSCHGITRRRHAASLQQEKHPAKSRVKLPQQTQPLKYIFFKLLRSDLQWEPPFPLQVQQGDKHRS